MALLSDVVKNPSGEIENTTKKIMLMLKVDYQFFRFSHDSSKIINKDIFTKIVCFGDIDKNSHTDYPNVKVYNWNPLPLTSITIL